MAKVQKGATPESSLMAKERRTSYKTKEKIKQQCTKNQRQGQQSSKGNREAAKAAEAMKAAEKQQRRAASETIPSQSE